MAHHRVLGLTTCSEHTIELQYVPNRTILVEPMEHVLQDLPMSLHTALLPGGIGNESTHVVSLQKAHPFLRNELSGGVSIN